MPDEDVDVCEGSGAVGVAVESRPVLGVVGEAKPALGLVVVRAVVDVGIVAAETALGVSGAETKAL